MCIEKMKWFLKWLKGFFEGEIVLKWSVLDGCKYWYVFFCYGVLVWKVLDV